MTITGTNFFGVSSVTFGSAPVSLFSVNSLGTQITLTTPPNPTGSATVTVTTVSGSATTSYSYTTGSVPGVTGVSPTFGYTVGGNSVIITGTNLTGATGVTFGTTPASFYVFSATQINAIAPAVTATGLIDVRVSTYAGTSATNSGDQYTYNQQPAPTVSSLSTTTGPTAGGTSVIITGTNFQNVSEVLFGNVPITQFTVNLSTSITVTTPPQPAGTLDVTVVTAGGTSVLNNGDRYNYSSLTAPTITHVSPATGTTAGTTSVTITGARFNGAVAVFFGTVPATQFTIQSGTSIVAVAPAQTVATVDITVVTQDGTSALTSADHYAYSAAAVPTVSGVGPNTGLTGGGLKVTITGNHLLGTTEVLFGGVAAPSFTIVSNTSVIAISPPDIAGIIYVQVVTTASSTPSATSGSDHFTYTLATPSVTAVTPNVGVLPGKWGSSPFSLEKRSKG